MSIPVVELQTVKYHIERALRMNTLARTGDDKFIAKFQETQFGIPMDTVKRCEVCRDFHISALKKELPDLMKALNK